MPALVAVLICVDCVLSVKLDFGDIASIKSSRRRTHLLRRFMNGRGGSANGLGHDDLIASIIVSTSSSESIASTSGAGVADGAEIRAFFGIRSLLADNVAFCIRGEPDESAFDLVQLREYLLLLKLNFTHSVAGLWISSGMQLIVHRMVAIVLQQLSWPP